MRFIAHVTDALLAVHRMVVEAPDKAKAVAEALRQVPHSKTVSIRREEAPHTVAGELRR